MIAGAFWVKYPLSLHLERLLALLDLEIGEFIPEFFTENLSKQIMIWVRDISTLSKE